MPEAVEIQTAASTKPVTRPPALVVNLDGTLVRTDLLLESILALLKQAPRCLFCLPFWLFKGKAYIKQQVARRVSLDVSLLPYRKDVIDYLHAQRAEGRSIVLATGGDVTIARQVADHLKLFEFVFASDGITNLSDEAKRTRLASEFGEKAFDYAGNDRHDIPVWASARRAIIAGASAALRTRVARTTTVDRVFGEQRKGLADYLKPLRFQHWLKNLLVFVPLLAAQRFDEPGLLAKAFLAFLAFGCFASGGYLMNDLLDLSADRSHPRKRNRPFAAGALPLSYAAGMILAMVGMGYILGSLVSPAFLTVASIYLGMSFTYSVYFKRTALLDVVVLAGLYTLRIMAGSTAVGIAPSPWLLAFSTFLFFSLALVKRYSELVANHGPARGYELSDEELLESMGIASGYLAVLVLALYINTATARSLYTQYGILWFLCPLLLYWLSHIWLSAHRGRMPDDPVVFATTDRTSRVLLLLMAATAALAL